MYTDLETKEKALYMKVLVIRFENYASFDIYIFIYFFTIKFLNPLYQYNLYFQ